MALHGLGWLCVAIEGTPCIALCGPAWLCIAIGTPLRGGRGEEEEGAGFAGEGGFSWWVQFSGGAGGSEGPGGAGWFWAQKFII